MTEQEARASAERIISAANGEDIYDVTLDHPAIVAVIATMLATRDMYEPPLGEQSLIFI